MVIARSCHSIFKQCGYMSYIRTTKDGELHVYHRATHNTSVTRAPPYWKTPTRINVSVSWILQDCIGELCTTYCRYSDNFQTCYVFINRTRWSGLTLSLTPQTVTVVYKHKQSTIIRHLTYSISGNHYFVRRAPAYADGRTHPRDNTVKRYTVPSKDAFYLN